MRTFLCFDIGGSKYNVGLLRQDGTILARQKSLWHGHSQQEMLAELFCAGHAVLAQCPGQAPCAAGATIPGLADAASGMWVEASFSGIRNVPIAHLLEQEFGLPAAIENDARACALAERMFGAGKDVDDFFYVTVSNGIGGALFLNGALYTGALGNAGEIGHCTAVENGRPCGCGKRGCLEAHAAGAWRHAGRGRHTARRKRNCRPRAGGRGSRASHLRAGRAAFGHSAGAGRKPSEPGARHTGRRRQPCLRPVWPEA